MKNLNCFIFPLIQSYEPRIVQDIYSMGYMVQKISDVGGNSIAISVYYDEVKALKEVINELRGILSHYYIHGAVFGSESYYAYINSNTIPVAPAAQKQAQAKAAEDVIKNVESGTDAIENVMDSFYKIVNKK